MKRWVIVLLALAMLGLTPIGVIIGSPRVRDYLYREISYQLITDRVVGSETDPERIAIQVSDYIEEALYPGGGPVLDMTVWSDLVRGIGWCDQDVWALATLLAKKDVPARMVMLRNAQGVSPHTVAEIFLDGKWRVFDPLFGLVFRKPDGSLVTLDDLSRDPSLIFNHPKIHLLEPSARSKVVEFFSKVFPMPNEPTTWAPLVEVNNSLFRWLTNRTIRLVLDGTGPLIAYWYQDLYLRLLPDTIVDLNRSAKRDNRANQAVSARRSENEPLFLYYKARNYHLYARAAYAEPLYRGIIERYGDSEYGEKSRFFLALARLQFHGDYQGAIDLFSDYLRCYPNSSWAGMVRYYRGQAYEKLGDFTKAELDFRSASTDAYTNAGLSLARLKPQRE